ncbi:hypothetical protein KR51_00025470 [Rubidibacter lacunae KORDI 51-2]|uniref:Uncharacterized protein n=1 Tax=Rubidibacter lacunae KORDI 51-2 TaxID=582515 RepID=U5DJ25_9CHRO|nr:hypothetical protein [Rubidibacter lacunae]ERN40937.1 hypothetical protein KR51_00025470 [Rubidibacter lacunae KORDI 51-2]
MVVIGAIERREIGPGAWVLAAPDGKAYELKSAPRELLQAGRRARVTGKLRDDVMTLAAIGPVLEVESFAWE